MRVEFSENLKRVKPIIIQESREIKNKMDMQYDACMEEINSKPHKTVRIDGKNIEVDAGIAPIIQILNDKGYKTVVCCEGHYKDGYDNYTPVWIAFDHGCLPPRPRIKGYERHAKQLQVQKYPSYWYGPRFTQCRPKTTSYYGRVLNPEIKIHFTKYKRDMKKKDIHEEHQRVLNELLEWAEALPMHNKEYSKRMEDWCHRPIGDIDYENGEWDNYHDIAEDISVDLDTEWEINWKCKLEKQII